MNNVINSTLLSFCMPHAFMQISNIILSVVSVLAEKV